MEKTKSPITNFFITLLLQLDLKTHKLLIKRVRRDAVGYRIKLCIQSLGTHRHNPCHGPDIGNQITRPLGGIDQPPRGLVGPFEMNIFKPIAREAACRKMPGRTSR